MGVWDIGGLSDGLSEGVGFGNGEVVVEDEAAPDWTFGKLTLVVVVYMSYAVKVNVRDATQANEDNVLEKGQYNV